MVVLSHCSAAPSLAIAGDSVYRMVPSDLHQAAAIARLIHDHGFDAGMGQDGCEAHGIEC
jgi:hypothetical protein